MTPGRPPVRFGSYEPPSPERNRIMGTIIDTAAAKLAADLRAEADRHERERHESWDRSDTDGFLSQWASGLSASLARAKANLIEQGNVAEFSALFDLEGQVISTHSGWGQYGPYFRLTDEAAERFGRRFINPSMANDPAREHANNAKKGVAVGTIRVAAYADLRGQSATSVGVCILPDVDALRRGDYEVVSTDNFRDEHPFRGF